MSEYIDGDVAEELNIAAEWDGSPKPLEMVTKDDKIVAFARHRSTLRRALNSLEGGGWDYETEMTMSNGDYEVEFVMKNGRWEAWFIS